MIQKITMDIQVAIQVKNSRARKKSKQDIYYGDSSTIAISDTGKIDAYLIEEINPPEGYEKSDLKVLIQVHKKRLKFKVRNNM